MRAGIFQFLAEILTAEANTGRSLPVFIRFRRRSRGGNMFKSENLKITKQDLSCVWIRANENPGAPLVCIWTDAKMRAFEEPERDSVEATVDSGPAEEGPATWWLTGQHVKHSVCA
jgi:hypothetical protein